MITKKYSNSESTQRNRHGNKKYTAKWPRQPNFGINGLQLESSCWTGFGGQMNKG